MSRWLFIGWAILLAAGLSTPLRADEPAPADVEFFEKQVRPILVERCYDCHSGDSAESDFRADSRTALLRGGKRGAAIVPGDPQSSLMILAINHADQLHMPPKSKIPQKEIAVLTAWVKKGAPWPGDNAPAPSPAKSSPADPAAVHKPDFSDAQRNYWSFQTPVKQSLPEVKHAAWVQSPIDAFVLARLEQAGLEPAPPADKRALIRRVTFNLIGLPPTPAEIDAFLADDSPQAFARVVDRLLASPHYGERWGRHWLDVARYGDSNGLDENLSFANAFRYRDYVIRAFNDDKPYDRFLLEQIAGDLLPDDDPAPVSDSLTATGFLAIAAKMLAEDDPVKMQMDIIDEQIDTLGKAVLGMTFGCARCHDHKFDPISTADYYRMAGIFKSTKTMENFNVVARWQERPLANRDELKELEAAKNAIAQLQKEADRLRSETVDQVLDDVRRHAGDYLLAAARHIRLERLLAGARPAGAGATDSLPTGALLLEAERFDRGNVLRDTSNYGQGIGVLVNAGPTPNFAEYDFDVPASGLYQIEFRYAAAESRPCTLSINRRVVKGSALDQATGSWTPDGQQWFIEGVFELSAGKNLIRIENPRAFPHVDKLLVLPASTRLAAELGSDLLAEPADASPLRPEFVRQWAGYLRKLDPAAAPLFAPWQAIALGNPVGALGDDLQRALRTAEGDTSPAALSRAYQARCATVTQAWRDALAADSGAKQLADADDEALRLVLFDPEGPLAVPESIEAHFPADAAARLAEQRGRIKGMEEALPRYPEVMAVSESKPQNVRIHFRGNHVTQGAEVARGFPTIMQGEAPPIPEDRSGRLELARWLASGRHPLTARVFVNRVWQGHFGAALVRSADNFGLLGAQPTHPELLDDLAVRFVESGWSIKALHRLILLSSTYQMSTAWDEAAAARDPENELLWRMNRRRLEAEAIRDAILACSGSLDTTMTGSLLPTPNRQYVTSTANINPVTYKTGRRSVYLPVVRSALFEVFQAFDFPDPTTSSGERISTTVAPQALFMMNSELTAVECRRWAETLLQDDSRGDADRLRALFERAYGRPPRDDETTASLAFLGDYDATLPADMTDPHERRARCWQSLCRAILSANEFLYVE